MQNNPLVSREEWIEARKDLLMKEKEFTRLRDQLSQQRRELPWVAVDQNYLFDGPNGKETLSDLFDGRNQLVIYHFMFHESWEVGCKSCSFWADNYNGIIVHLNHRDVSMVTISQAPLEKLEAFKQRMGWNFKWMSSAHNSFNQDYHVSKTPQETENEEMYYNYRLSQFPAEEAPGISVFYKDEEGRIFHTYSCYARGLDMLNGAYHYLDLVPKGRDEGGSNMFWLRLHDQYED